VIEGVARTDDAAVAPGIRVWAATRDPRWKRPPVWRVSPNCWTSSPPTTRKARMTSRNRMCPAFGSLRVGLRMKRVATVLSGSACCVYGLTFVSHFYGARRSVGYVPFNSETLVTGKLFEDIRDSVHDLADPGPVRRHRGDQPVRAHRVGRAAAASARRDQRRAHRRHRRAGLRDPDPCRGQGCAGRCDAELRPQAEAEAGPVPRPRAASPTADRDAPGRDVPGRSDDDRAMLAPMGLAAGPVVPCREWRELYAALDCGAVAAIHPFYTAAVREFEAAGRPVRGQRACGRRRHRRLAGRDRRELRHCGRPGRRGAERLPARDQGRAEPAPRINGTITLSGYEGSELLVARLLIESGADVPYVGTACPKRRGTAGGCRLARGAGVKVKFRASLEDDCAAMEG
jgi:chlorophyllide a reductase subunit Y